MCICWPLALSFQWWWGISWKYLNRVKVKENLHNEIWICVIQTGKKKDIWVFKSRFHKDFRRVLFWVCGVHEQYILKSQCKDNHARRKKWFDPQNIWFLFHKHRTILNHEDRMPPPLFFTDLQISNVVGVFFSALFKQ